MNRLPSPAYYRPGLIKVSPDQPQLLEAARAGLASCLRPVTTRETGTLLLAVDLLNGFMDFDVQSLCELPVPGTAKMVQSVVDYVYGFPETIDGVMMVGDDHPPFTIDSMAYWRRPNGSMVQPNTLISYGEVKCGELLPIFPEDREWCEYYLQRVEREKLPPVIAWKGHCRWGTPGAALVGALAEAIEYLSVGRGFQPEYMAKGFVRQTAWYGAFAPVIPYRNARKNTAALKRIGQYRKVVMAGVAGDFCQQETARQIVRYFLKVNPAFLRNVFFVTDWTALVFESSRPAYEEFLEWLRSNYVNVVRSEDLPGLLC